MSCGFQSPNVQVSLSTYETRVESYWGWDKWDLSFWAAQSLLSTIPCRNRYILILSFESFLVQLPSSHWGLEPYCHRAGARPYLTEKERKAGIRVLISHLWFWPGEGGLESDRGGKAWGRREAPTPVPELRLWKCILSLASSVCTHGWSQGSNHAFEKVTLWSKRQAIHLWKKNHSRIIQTKDGDMWHTDHNTAFPEPRQASLINHSIFPPNESRFSLRILNTVNQTWTLNFLKLISVATSIEV